VDSISGGAGYAIVGLLSGPETNSRIGLNQWGTVKRSNRKILYLQKREGEYGKEYKLKVDPSLVGPSIDKEFYDSLIWEKATLGITEEFQKLYKPRKLGRRFYYMFKDL